MPDTETKRYRFDAFTVDLTRACLLRDGEQVDLRPRSFDALCFLIKHRGHLATKEALMQALWPRTVVTDDSLVKCIQDVRTALGDDGTRYLKTVQRRGYIFDAPVIVETSDSAAGTQPRDATGAVPPRTTDAPPRASRSRVALVVTGAALAAVAIGTLVLFLDGRPRTTLPRSVAVLPFENLSADASNEYFAAGIHESLLNQLARMDGLNVIARTSVLRYAGSTKPVSEVARELNVEMVVEGSVQYDQGRVRVTAQLIDPANDTHVWSEEYDRPLADIFAIQTELATRIATALNVEISVAEQRDIARPATSSPEAYELYLRGRYHWDKWSGAEAARSVEYFEHAIALDANFALAYAGLADANTALQGLGAAPSADVMPNAKRAVERALAIDPELPEAYIARGLIKHFYDWDYVGGNADFEHAIALDPRSATAHQLYGKNLVVTLQFDRALAELDEAIELDPFSVGAHKDRAETLYLARRYDAAIEQFERVLEIEPNSGAALYWLSRCYEAKGAHDDAVRYQVELLALVDKDNAARLQEVYRQSGWEAFWRASLARLGEVAAQRYIEPFNFVDIEVRLGDTAAAFEWLDRSLEARSAWIPVLAIYPHLDPLRGDPRFAELERRAGLRPNYIPEP